MRLRLPSLGSIIWQDPDGGYGDDIVVVREEPTAERMFERMSRGRRPPSSASFVPEQMTPVRIPRPEEYVPRGFAPLLGRMLPSDTRTKPAYSDCWILEGAAEMDVLASYRTPFGSVVVGNCPDGETEYDAMPLEYAYPGPLNGLVTTLIRDIKSRYMESGGRLDRDSVMLTARSILMGMGDELESCCPEGSDPASIVDDICSVAYRHSVGAGVFEVLLSDPHIEDVYVDAPCDQNRIHVTMNGIDGLNSHIRCRTNLMADRRELANLINILKRESGLRFCQSNPVLETDFPEFDARATVVGYPMSPLGDAVAIRKRSNKPWTLSRLVANGTVDPRSAGLLSFLVRNRSTMLVCGARGAGKSSLLSALMFEFPADQRILTIEDTMELPGESMRRIGYKVQSILVDDRMDGDQRARSDEALRVSLRMGESAIILGEVRGDEAKTLYQSMRTGRAGSSIMGTVHGDSAASVYQRMVHDIGIPPEAFQATDVVVTLGTVRDRRTGHLIRRLNEISCTTGVPGEFSDMMSEPGMLDSDVVRRAMRTSQMGRREVLREMEACGLMRSVLAEAGRRDERFLGPEWILVANDILSRSDRSATPEDIAGSLRSRLAGASG